MRALLNRLLSPAGFVLVGLLFLLPFATASCGAFAFTYTGVDLAAGNRPAPDPRLVALARDRGTSPTELNAELRRSLHPVSAQWPVTLAIGIVVVGVLTTVLVRRAGVRAAAAMCVALAAAVALLAAEIVASDAVYQRFAADAVPVMGTDADDFVAVDGAYGFWLALGVLVVLFVGNGAYLIRLARPPTRNAA